MADEQKGLVITTIGTMSTKELSANSQVGPAQSLPACGPTRSHQSLTQSLAVCGPTQITHLLSITKHWGGFLFACFGFV